jgi:lysophospholipase L1-like esterase
MDGSLRCPPGNAMVVDRRSPTCTTRRRELPAVSAQSRHRRDFLPKTVFTPHPRISMKNLLTLSLLSIALLAPARADLLIQPNDVVGIAGDSITQQHLYTAFMEDYLLMCQPTAGQKIVQFGWGGEQAPGFLGRLDTDVYPFKPTVMTTCYGMNDGHYTAITDSIASTYRTAQTAIVESLKKHGVRVIVLGSSKCVDTTNFRHADTPADVYNQNLGALAAIDKDIAAKEGVVYAPVFEDMLDTMKKAKAKFGDDYNFGGGDGVHPGPNGHLVMAYAFLKALGCDGNIGTITVDYGSKQATGSPGQEIVSYQDGTVNVKSTRYPFCFSGTLDSKKPDDTAAVTQVFPFNDDLNRYLLVVKGLTTPKAKITWGATTKEYTAGQLAQGINLAAEFLVNPFVDQFNKVDGAVHVQENQETMLFQMFMHNVPGWEKDFAPGADDAFAQIIAAGMKQHEALYKAAQDLVVPITHTIKIEPEP